MLIQELKVFRDNVHGYISIPVDYVANFIDTDIFQRLRNIEQTGMRILYPSARHDRFIHSLGTYYLGHKAFECFKRNIQRSYQNLDGVENYFKVYDNNEINEKFWDKCQFLFEIACLLHDCGHAPFSHALEFHYDTLTNSRQSLTEKMREYVGSRDFQNDFERQGGPHERMSALLVCTNYSQNIENLIKKYKLDCVNDGDPVELIVRMIIGCKYKKQNKSNQIKNCLISLLNSKSIDVDSLDYIIRDAKMSGVDNMSVDVDRLLGSLTLIETTEFKNCRFRNREISANVINGRLESNGHHARLIGKCRGEAVLNNVINGKLRGFIDVDGNLKTNNSVPIKPANNDGAILLINGANYLINDPNNSDKVPEIKSSASIRVQGIIDEDLRVQGTEVNFLKQTNAQVDLEADMFGLKCTFIDAKLDGIFNGQLLGNFTHISGGQLKCTLGYHKSSLSVIQNVILARNYEYQWIYTHHKVVYYSNFLIIDLFRNCIDFLLDNKKEEEIEDKQYYDTDEVIANIISWETMINHSDKEKSYKPFILENYKFFRTTDADILALFKQCWLKCNNDSLLGKQLNEYYTRKYRKSLWKSYAEFNIFFSEFTDSEKSNLFQKIMDNSSYHLKDQYGYLSENWEQKFNSFGLKNIIWVNGNSKLKYLDPDNTYIKFKDCSLTYRTVDSSDTIRAIDKLNLFYIYYDCIDDNIDIKNLKEFLYSQVNA